ncbi:hypothetical protein QBC46DRAFT_439607 [Diplogelasinospora grovesii]|uniref:UPF0261 domain-containing protein n=1 Tax=Diplogelasinospora grovesii TaxID=303347 RepID=A0AAN6N3Z0_9PEZI|nr:hypothetical protein QBC46DRAFT_439607 [Diplogelasinospora grovesii]
MPRGGLSAISTPGGPFEDQQADAVLFSAIREGLQGSGVKIVEDERDINNRDFAIDIAEALARLMEMDGQITAGTGFSGPKGFPFRAGVFPPRAGQGGQLGAVKLFARRVLAQPNRLVIGGSCCARQLS